MKLLSISEILHRYKEQEQIIDNKKEINLSRFTIQENDVFNESICEYDKKIKYMNQSLLNEEKKQKNFDKVMKMTRHDLKKALNATKNLLGEESSKITTLLKTNQINDYAL